MNSKAGMTSGGAFMIFSSNALMSMKKFASLVVIGLIAWVVVSIMATHFFLSAEDLEAIKCWVFSCMPFAKNIKYVDPSTGAVTIYDAATFGVTQVFKHKLILLYGGSFVLGFIGTLVTGEWWLSRKAEKMSKPQYIEGAKVIPVSELNKQMEKRKEIKGAPIGSTWFPRAAENMGMMIVGAARSGKTIIMTAILNFIMREPGVKGIVYGYRPQDYFMRFYKAGRDLLFCPIDSRGIQWNIFKEINPSTAAFDIAAIAGCLIPTPAGSGQNSWVYEGARTIFEAILTYLYTNNMRTMKDLWTTLTLETKELAELLKGHPGCEAGVKLLAETKGGTAADTRVSSMTEHTKFFAFMTGEDDGFSIDAWLHNGKPGYIFLQNNPAARDMLKPILTLFVDMLARRICDLDKNPAQKIFFMADEVGTLGKMPSVIELITRAGAKNVCTIIGTQDIGQIDEMYGEKLRASIQNSTGTKIVLRCPDAQTAEQMSKLIGDQKVKEITASTQGGPIGQYRDGQTMSEHIVIRRAVMPATIQKMRVPVQHGDGKRTPGAAYIQFPGYDWTWTDIHIKDYPDIADAFIPSANIRIGGNGNEDGATA